MTSLAVFRKFLTKDDGLVDASLIHSEACYQAFIQRKFNGKSMKAAEDDMHKLKFYRILTNHVVRLSFVLSSLPTLT
jgi:hypothetical protein